MPAPARVRVDPARLADEVRWEPGVPTDPASMRFPHLYGPLPVAAVTSVVPYTAGADGTFAPPGDVPAPERWVGAHQLEQLRCGAPPRPEPAHHPPEQAAQLAQLGRARLSGNTASS